MLHAEASDWAQLRHLRQQHQPPLLCLHAQQRLQAAAWLEASRPSCAPVSSCGAGLPCHPILAPQRHHRRGAAGALHLFPHQYFNHTTD